MLITVDTGKRMSVYALVNLCECTQLTLLRALTRVSPDYLSFLPPRFRPTERAHPVCPMVSSSHDAARVHVKILGALQETLTYFR